MITLRTYTPVNLSPIVKSIWQLRVADVNCTSYREDILPDGHHEIIFHVSGKNAKRTTEQANWIKEPEAFFAGQTLRSYSLELENNALLYGIRFQPHTMHVLFGFPADLATNNMLPLHAIPAARILQHGITDSFEETCGNLEKVLLQLCKGTDLGANKFQYIDYAVREILKHKGDVSISHLLKGAGISQRHFDTLFKKSVGINPKPFCNIVKLNHFINYKRSYPHKKLIECCYELNFFDQSHLIKLFRTITQRSPKEYFRNYNHINNYFVGL